MKKNGFTLAELIGVVIIVALIVVLALPPILGSINDNKDDLSEAALTILYTANEQYLSDNSNLYPNDDGSTYCVTINELIEKNYLSSPVLDPVTNEEISGSDFIKTEINAGIYNYYFVETCSAN